MVLLSITDNAKNCSHPRGLKSKSLHIKKYLKFPKTVFPNTVHVGAGIQFFKKWQNNKKIVFKQSSSGSRVHSNSLIKTKLTRAMTSNNGKEH